jgi:hypothetical protein
MTRRCRLLLAGLCLAGLCAAAAPPAQAQEAGWEGLLSVPLGLRFTHDPQTAEPPLATFPLGLHAALLSPWHVGLGLARYRTRFDSVAFPYANRTVDYRLAEVLGALDFPQGWLALGYGAGRATFTPVAAASNGLSQDFLASPAQEWLVLAAYRFPDQWDVVLGFHLLQVDARRTTDGVPAHGALDAQLLSAGAGYRF